MQTYAQTFRQSHPVLYEGLLVAGLTIALTLGVGKAAQAHPSLADTVLTPPASIVPQPAGKAAPTKTQLRVDMARFGNIKTLPGDNTTSPPAYFITPTAAVPPASSSDALNLGRAINARWFGDSYWSALYQLWMRESHWNPAASNRSSGACGIPQALPCSKITDMSTQGQIIWGLQYIQNRYDNPAAAWAHSQRYGWY
jgi:hypothetical protein